MSVRHDTCLFLALALSSSGAAGQEVTAEPASYAIQNLGNDLYILRSPARNIVVATGNEDAVVVDNASEGLTAEDIAAVRANIDRALRFVVTTRRESDSQQSNDSEATSRFFVAHNDTSEWMDRTTLAARVGCPGQLAPQDLAVVTL